MIKYRMRFSKIGTAAYISHLDLLRIFSRCARRTHIPLSYSQGFNPHPQIVFSAPIPLGMTSEAEYIDMTLEEKVGESELMNKFTDNLPEGIIPAWVKELPGGESTIMKPVDACEYYITLSFPEGSPEAFETASRDCLAQEELRVMKKSKSGVKETDIRPLIYSFYRVTEFTQKYVYKAVLSAGNEKTLRPETVISAFGNGAVIESIHKLNYMDKDGKIIG